MREHVGANVKVKAAGGIKTIEDAVAMIEAGAERLGASQFISTASLKGLQELRTYAKIINSQNIYLNFNRSSCFELCVRH